MPPARRRNGCRALAAVDPCASEAGTGAPLTGHSSLSQTAQGPYRTDRAKLVEAKPSGTGALLAGPPAGANRDAPAYAADTRSVRRAAHGERARQGRATERYVAARARTGCALP